MSLAEQHALFDELRDALQEVESLTRELKPRVTFAVEVEVGSDRELLRIDFHKGGSHQRWGFYVGGQSIVHLPLKQRVAVSHALPGMLASRKEMINLQAEHIREAISTLHGVRGALVLEVGRQ